MTPTSLKISQELKAKLKAKAAKENRSLHNYLINLLTKLHK